MTSASFCCLTEKLVSHRRSPWPMGTVFVYEKHTPQKKLQRDGPLSSTLGRWMPGTWRGGGVCGEGVLLRDCGLTVEKR